MKQVKGILIVMELVLGFAFPVYMWVLGVIMSPFMLMGLFIGGEISLVVSLMAIMCGGFGLWGMLQLTVKVLSPNTRVASARRLVIYISLGYVALALAILLLGFELQGFIFIFVPPLIISAQFLYMARRYLKGTVSNTLQPAASEGS